MTRKDRVSRARLIIDAREEMVGPRLVLLGVLLVGALAFPSGPLVAVESQSGAEDEAG